MSFFDAVLGQHQVKEQISTLIQDSALPHSLLLYGESGLESVSMAAVIIGIFKVILSAILVGKSASVGNTWL